MDVLSLLWRHHRTSALCMPFVHFFVVLMELLQRLSSESVGIAAFSCTPRSRKGSTTTALTPRSVHSPPASECATTPSSSSSSPSFRIRSASKPSELPFSRQLAPRVRASLHALSRIVEVRIHQSVKTKTGLAYVMELVISDKDARLRIVHTTRYFKEFKKLQHAVSYWAERHCSNEPGCAYCLQFCSPLARQLWPGAVANMLLPTRSMQQLLSARVNELVAQARGDQHYNRRANACDALSHIAPIVTGFILKDIDPGSL